MDLNGQFAIIYYHKKHCTIYGIVTVSITIFHSCLNVSNVSSVYSGIWKSNSGKEEGDGPHGMPMLSSDGIKISENKRSLILAEHTKSEQA